MTTLQDRLAEIGLEYQEFGLDYEWLLQVEPGMVLCMCDGKEPVLFGPNFKWSDVCKRWGWV